MRHFLDQVLLAFFIYLFLFKLHSVGTKCLSFMFYIQNNTEPIGLWDLPKSYGWKPCLQKKQKNIVSELLSLLNYLDLAFSVHIPSHVHCSDVLHLFLEKSWEKLDL